jgi:hypothetical protein
LEILSILRRAVRAKRLDERSPRPSTRVLLTSDRRLAKAVGVLCEVDVLD